MTALLFKEGRTFLTVKKEAWLSELTSLCAAGHFRYHFVQSKQEPVQAEQIMYLKTPGRAT